MEINNYKRRFKTLFDKFTQKNYHLRPYYPKAIVKYFESCSDKSIEKQLLETAFFSDLVLSAILNAEQITCTTIKTFLIEIVTILIKNELQYCKLMYLYGFQTMVSKISKIGESATAPDYQLAFIKLSTALISHSPGLLTIVEQKSWLYILTPYTHHKPVVVARSIYNFIFQLVWKLNEVEEEQALMELFKYILTPLMSKYQLTTVEVQNEKVRSDQVLTFLYAFQAIFDVSTNLMRPSLVMHLLKKTFIIQGHLHFLARVSRDDEVQMVLTESLFRYFIASYKDSAVTMGKSDNELLNEIMSSYNNIVAFLIQTRMVNVLVSFIIKCLIYWSKLDSMVVIPQTFDFNGQQFDMRNQLVLLVVVPILTYASYCSNEKTLTDTFYLKFTAISTEHIIKSHYKYKSLVESGDIKKICLHSIREAFKLKGHLNASQAGIIYQALFYALECHVSTDGSGSLISNGNSLSSTEDIRILTFVLDLMLKVLQVYHINWYDSIEIICFQTTLMNMLKQNILPSKILIQVLNLIDLSIKKFLSPDLTLLVESKNGSTLNETVKVVKSFMHHEEWEVRDSALQIVLSCTEISYIKYVPLKKLISQNNLIVEAVRIGFNDPEFYVQATAMKCLAAATRIDSIWREVMLVHPHINYQLAYMLRHNPEGILRMEAANVLTELYVYQRLPQAFISPLYGAMTKSAIDDLHWEVQSTALNFWKQVVQTLLSDRGMIDGKFPSVTFSKDKRKIISLNDSEIKKQLTLLMNSLSSFGCLTVLYECLNEDFNIKVMEQAFGIAKDIVDILDYYKFEVPLNNILPSPYVGESQYSHTNLPEKSMHLNVINIPGGSLDMDERDNIIDKITSTNDAELVEEICNNYISIKSDEEDEIFSMQPQRNLILPHVFLLNYKQTDYLSIIKNKTNWNRISLEMLLDDILNLRHESYYHDKCGAGVKRL